MEQPATPTRDDLARLLAAKDQAQKAMSAAYAAIFANKDLPADARLALDMDRKRALQTFCTADRAYDDALTAFIAAEKVAA